MPSTTAPQIGSRRQVFASLLVLTLLSGVVHGVLDGRWSVHEDKVAHGNLLNDLPESFGEWTLVEHGDIHEGALQQLRCYGSVRNVYRHGPTNTLLNVAVMYGPRGPIAVHTPEVCYSSEGTEQTRKRSKETVETDSGPNQFWSVEFARRDDPSSRFEVWYGWTSGANWTAAEHPRFWLTDDLYKIQLSGPSTYSSFSPCKSFLTDFLPHLEQHIK
ncbi:hypothetical protein Mal15_36750 [Stieleria maiorica]|uniref:Methanolan biosynthesis EpsI domain-containing protein n=1 Tax=Stieleria maiorica TaxID=2795974 RepID=A0A5B9MGI2_9BACT|nr:exosortase-associated EpsI family protein [Stieleria maiorica]QEF99609.1 hypothetical protein Mal15_36750 [Stieleria maiorica]